METWETGDSWQLRPCTQEEMTENEWMNSLNPSKLDLICFWKGSENGTEPSLLSLNRGQGVTTNKCTSHSVLWREGTAQNKVEVKWNRLRCRLVYQRTRFLRTQSPATHSLNLLRPSRQKITIKWTESCWQCATVNARHNKCWQSPTNHHKKKKDS